MGRFNRIEEAIQDIKNGRIVILVDDEDRENEGDLVMAEWTGTHLPDLDPGSCKGTSVASDGH